MLPPPDLPLEPGPSRRGWTIGLYLEHLEEASALYDQRRAGLDDPELSWLDLADYEDRMEAHLDALVLGGRLALDVCRQQARDGDAGERHAAVRVYARHGLREAVAQAVEATDPEDEEALDALADAVVWEAPAGWETDYLTPEALRDPRRLRLAAELTAQRRLSHGYVLAPLLHDATGVGLLRLVRALARSADTVPAEVLLPLLQHADAAVRVEAGRALLRNAGPDALRRVFAALGRDGALYPLLGLAGQAAAVPWLRSGLSAPEGEAAGALLALGLLGDPTALPDLLRALPGDDGDAAATALHLLTGADLRDEVFVPDVPEEDERFDDERAEEEADDVGPEASPEAEPVGEEEPPRGTTLTPLSRDPERWRAWLDAHAQAFSAGTRYRLGRPAGPESQIVSLGAPALRRTVRDWIYEELVVRYGLPVPFETTWPVAHQRAAAVEMRRWAAGRARSFTPGEWYVAGHDVS